MSGQQKARLRGDWPQKIRPELGSPEESRRLRS